MEHTFLMCVPDIEECLMCVSCQKSAALASEGAASQRAGTALRRGENTNKLSYFSTLVAKRRWASFSLTMGTSIAGSLGRHAGKLPNHAGRGHRRPHHYHPHPIAQFPVHCVEPGRYNNNRFGLRKRLFILLTCCRSFFPSFRTFLRSRAYLSRYFSAFRNHHNA